jgi:hypothetical protein
LFEIVADKTARDVDAGTLEKWAKQEDKEDPDALYSVDYYRNGDSPEGGEMYGMYSSAEAAAKAAEQVRKWAATITDPDWKIVKIQVSKVGGGKKATTEDKKAKGDDLAKDAADKAGKERFVYDEKAKRGDKGDAKPGDKGEKKDGKSWGEKLTDLAAKLAKGGAKAADRVVKALKERDAKLAALLKTVNGKLRDGKITRKGAKALVASESARFTRELEKDLLPAERSAVRAGGKEALERFERLAKKLDRWEKVFDWGLTLYNVATAKDWKHEAAKEAVKKAAGWAAYTLGEAAVVGLGTLIGVAGAPLAITGIVGGIVIESLVGDYFGKRFDERYPAKN